MGFFRQLPEEIMRISLLIPYLLPSVTVALSFRMMLSPNYGIINKALEGLGITAPNWFSDMRTALPMLILIDIWQNAPFVFLLLYAAMQAIPKSQYEAAKIDGCSSLGILLHLILPLSKSALFSVAIFAFLWNWDDFQNQLLYLSNIKTYTVPLALRSTIDVGGADNWGAIMAMSFVSMLPAIILFFSLQQYFVEGIASTGIKG